METKQFTTKKAETIKLIDTLTKLRDMIPTIPDREFNMSQWWNTECHTVGCIIGHGVHRGILKTEYYNRTDNINHALAADSLGLPMTLPGLDIGKGVRILNWLISPQYYDLRTGDPAKQEAIRRLGVVIDKLKEQL